MTMWTAVPYPRPLVMREIAWCCDVWRIAGGRVAAPFDDLAAAAPVIAPAAARVLLEYQLIDGRGYLIHRAGWPFDLWTLAADPTGHAPAALRPRGAGDEVFRELIDAFEAQVAGATLHVYHSVGGG